MSRYTTQLRYICESLAGYEHSVGLGQIDDVLEKSVDKIFDFQYNYYDEDRKRDFEKMILRHFYQEEIGFETYGAWKLAFSSWFIENMEYYNKLYLAVTKYDFNPLNEIDVTTTRDIDGSLKTDGKTTSKNKSDNWNLYSETPQGGLEGVKSNKYLTTAQNDTADNTNEEILDNKNIETRNEVVKEQGHRTSYIKLFTEYLKGIKNIDVLILQELEKFFIGLYL